MTRASGRDRLLLMQVEPDPPVEVGEGVAEGADEDGLPETEGDAVDGEGEAGAESSCSHPRTHCQNHPRSNIATGWAGESVGEPRVVDLGGPSATCEKRIQQSDLRWGLRIPGSVSE
jgi:hypothetical protein